MNSCKACKLDDEECICEDITRFFNENGHLMRKDEVERHKITKLPLVFNRLTLIGHA